MSDFGGKISGEKELLAGMKSVPAAMRAGVYTFAMRPAVKRVAKKAKANAEASNRKDSGALARAVGDKVKAFKRGGTVVGLIGIDRDAKETVTRKGRKTPEVVRPKNYAHLIERGTSTQPASPFMRSAWESEKDAAFGDIAKRIDKGLDREIKKAKKKL